MKEPPRRYASAAAFRVALEIRLKAISRAEGIDLQRLRRQVSFGDAVVQPTELIEGRNWLDFAGIPAAMLMAISKEQQFAEKFHAATPRLVQQPGERPCGHGITGSSANNGQVPPPPSDFSDIQHSRNAPDSSQSAGTACLLDSPISCPRTGVSY
jgi:hypothetical protein